VLTDTTRFPTEFRGFRLSHHHCIPCNKPTAQLTSSNPRVEPPILTIGTSLLRPRVTPSTPDPYTHPTTRYPSSPNGHVQPPFHSLGPFHQNALPPAQDTNRSARSLRGARPSALGSVTHATATIIARDRLWHPASDRWVKWADADRSGGTCVAWELE
jgi:hypothetical protein